MICIRTPPLKSGRKNVSQMMFNVLKRMQKHFSDFSEFLRLTKFLFVVTGQIQGIHFTRSAKTSKGSVQMTCLKALYFWAKISLRTASNNLLSVYDVDFCIHAYISPNKYNVDIYANMALS